MGQIIIALPSNKVKDILSCTIPKLTRKKMIKQGCNYVDGGIQAILGLFETTS